MRVRNKNLKSFSYLTVNNVRKFKNMALPRVLKNVRVRPNLIFLALFTTGMKNNSDSWSLTYTFLFMLDGELGRPEYMGQDGGDLHKWNYRKLDVGGASFIEPFRFANHRI